MSLTAKVTCAGFVYVTEVSAYATRNPPSGVAAIAGWTPTWYAVTDEFRAHVGSTGADWQTTQIGEDAVLDLPASLDRRQAAEKQVSGIGSAYATRLALPV